MSQKHQRSQPPEGIIVTIGAKMIGENSYRHWLKNFQEAMERSETDDDWFYWLRQGNQPTYQDIQYVYLCIGGKIRYRTFYAGSFGPREMRFIGKENPIFGNAWILIAGPLMRAPFRIEKKGFQGFRYTDKLF